MNSPPPFLFMKRIPTPRHSSSFTDVTPALDVRAELESTDVTCVCGVAVTLSSAGEHILQCSAAGDFHRSATEAAQSQWRRHVARLVPSMRRSRGGGGRGSTTPAPRGGAATTTFSPTTTAIATTTTNVVALNSSSSSPSRGVDTPRGRDEDENGYVNRATFTCPLCVQDGHVSTGAEDHPGCHLDCEGLMNHLENHHHAGTTHPRPAVCPVCASMPWGRVRVYCGGGQIKEGGGALVLS